MDEIRLITSVYGTMQARVDSREHSDAEEESTSAQIAELKRKLAVLEKADRQRHRAGSHRDLTTRRNLRIPTGRSRFTKPQSTAAVGEKRPREKVSSRLDRRDVHGKKH